MIDPIDFRTLMDQSGPPELTRDELLRCAKIATPDYSNHWKRYLEMMRAAIAADRARWGRPTPQPVPVSERLPGPEDCDEQGRCWVFDDQLGLPSWTLIRVQGASLDSDMHWLPANALPTPEALDD